MRQYGFLVIRLWHNPLPLKWSRGSGFMFNHIHCRGGRRSVERHGWCSMTYLGYRYTLLGSRGRSLVSVFIFLFCYCSNIIFSSYTDSLDRFVAFQPPDLPIPPYTPSDSPSNAIPQPPGPTRHCRALKVFAEKIRLVAGRRVGLPFRRRVVMRKAL
jgi:hypothetical protein